MYTEDGMGMRERKRAQTNSLSDLSALVPYMFQTSYRYSTWLTVTFKSTTILTLTEK